MVVIAVVAVIVDLQSIQFRALSSSVSSWALLVSHHGSETGYASGINKLKTQHITNKTCPDCRRVRRCSVMLRTCFSACTRLSSSKMKKTWHLNPAISQSERKNQLCPVGLRWALGVSMPPSSQQRRWDLDQTHTFSLEQTMWWLYDSVQSVFGMVVETHANVF
jgi:hypothetical protein